MWQRVWDDRGRDFLMLAIAQDARGAEVVAPAVAARGVDFPVLLDPGSTIAAAAGFRIVPSGFFVDDDGSVPYLRTADFDVNDPRDRANLDAWLDGRPVEPVDESERMDPRALELFAEGAAAYAAGRTDGALALWREALRLDEDNFLIRSQIWAAERPERFWPVVDRDWQALQLAKEGYDKPLP